MPSSQGCRSRAREHQYPSPGKSVCVPFDGNNRRRRTVMPAARSKGRHVPTFFCSVGRDRGLNSPGCFGQAAQQQRGHRRNLPSAFLLYLCRSDGRANRLCPCFPPDQTSASIGWATSPYEYEVGIADLTVGVLAFCASGFVKISGWRRRLRTPSGCSAMRRDTYARCSFSVITLPITPASSCTPRF